LPGVGIGRIGRLAKPIDIAELAGRVKEAFGIEHVVVYGRADRKVSRVAISPGSVGSVLESALAKGAELLISGDIGHHDGLDAWTQGMMVMDARHYGIEKIFVKDMHEYLGKCCEGIELLESQDEAPYLFL
jgi:putative NIF3 family GTP cyclohydrolase 1 type 2